MMRIQRWVRYLIGAVVMAGAVTAGEAWAAESAPVTTSHTRATLVTDHDAIGPDHHLAVGLRLQLQPGWHTYWINPGDAGDAPSMTVEVSGALQGRGNVFRWPVPERINEGGLMAYAYTGDILLPQVISLSPDMPEDLKTEETPDLSPESQQVTLKAHAEWLVCETVCVPEEGDFTLTLPLTNRSVPDSREAVLFHKTEAAMPQSLPFHAALEAVTAGVSALSSDGHEIVLVLTGQGISPRNVHQAWFLPMENGVIQQTASQPLMVRDGELRLTLTPDPVSRPPYWTRPLSGVVVMVDEAGNHAAIEVTAPPPLPPGPVPGIVPGALHTVSTMGWGGALRFLVSAFLGGLILNLMPCVFPVLAMKALSLARMGGRARREQITSAGFYTLGVMGSFLVLGGVMIALRLAGSVAGWGFQFQSPGFVVFICWLLLLMALNLLGVFQIVGGRLTRRLTGHIPAGQSHAGDLMTGLLAVIVATPCTAPFMGVAIAGALGGPVLLGFLVFLVMGLGLAFPYLLIAVVPGLAARLPRPGVWMDIFKQFLAFPLLATCVWLLWVAGVQRGPGLVAVTAGGAVLLGLAAWLYGLAQERAMREGGTGSIRLCQGLALLCVLLGVGMLVRFLMFPVASPSLSSSPSQTGKEKIAATVEPFAPQRLAALRAEDRPVLVDMTASWCITCMINERVALNASSVQKAFARHHVVTLRGDWTNRNESITTYLRAHGRNGVPLYIYYPPHGEERTLPQLLTPGMILELVGK